MLDQDNPNRGACLVVPAINCMPATTASPSFLCLLTAREGCEWLEHFRLGKSLAIWLPLLARAGQSPSVPAGRPAPLPAVPKPARMAPFYSGANSLRLIFLCNSGKWGA